MFQGGLKPFVFSLLLIAGLLTGSVQAKTFDDFLASRQVVCTVQFELGSSGLDNSARTALDKVVRQLAAVDQQGQVIRVEGFSSADGTELANLNLSMSRAKSVEDYLREKHNLPLNRYLIGRGVSSEEGMAKEDQRRVEVAIYDNLLDIENTNVEKVVFDGKRGN